MTAKLISELTADTPVYNDLLAFADPTSGIATKATIASVVAAGISSPALLTTTSAIAYTPTTINATTNLNDLNIGTAGIIFLNATVAVDLTGMDGTIVSGKLLWVINTGTQAVSVKNESASSTASMRIRTPGGGSLNMQTGHALLCIYDSTLSRWRVWMLT